MRIVLTLVLMIMGESLIAKDPSPPQILNATVDFIKGKSKKGYTICISWDRDKTADATISTQDDGSFLYIFDTRKEKGEVVIMWAVNEKGELSSTVVNLLKGPSDSPSLSEDIIPLEDLKGKTLVYKATVWNTNFSIPLARFNFVSSNTTKIGDLSLFNSIGAGFGRSKGELTETRDDQGNVTNQDFINTFGVHLGFLFSAGNGESSKNVFAPIINFSILDFQLGLGYELGSVTESQKRGFLSFSYAIPIYKLKKGGSYIKKKTKPLNLNTQDRQGL